MSQQSCVQCQFIVLVTMLSVALIHLYSYVQKQMYT